AFLDGGPGEMAAVLSPLTLEAYLARDPSPGKALGAPEAAEAESLKKRARGLVQILARVDEETVAALVEAAARCAGGARERLLAGGLVSYEALLRLARDLLARIVPVRRDLGARFRAILVDEFQDTDPLQYEILFFVAEEDGAAAADAYEAKLAP